MEIRVKINKSTVQKSHKVSPHSLTSDSMTFTISNHGTGYLNRTGEYFMGLHYEKHNRKVKSSNRVTKIHNGQNVMTPIRKYEAGYWKVTYYKIPVEVLKIAGLKFKQNARNFELIKK